MRILRVFKRREYGNTRDTAYADVHVINKETGEPIREKTVRARNIFMRWEEYEVEDKRRRARREEIAKEQEQARIAEQEAKQKITTAIVAKFGNGFDPLWVSNISDYRIQLDRAAVEKWLGVKNA